MGLFSKKEEFCTVCKKRISHKHKPKRGWNVEGPLCADCYVDLMKMYYEKNDENKCVLCGARPGSFSLWKPRKEWELKGWLCKSCFDEKEKSDNESKKFCSMCGTKLGFISYSPKKEWGIKGYICKNCWNLQETKTGA
ncbi:MAG TPA: hypothetical protein VK431_02380 [Nitrosopumilaceae archaeon]|nr:hypothetical protein [Nitrosopumilaceae archaeon]